MRRLLAIFVVSVVGLGSIAPMALAATDANAPACCRRDGKHRCAGMPDIAGMPGMSAGSRDGLPILRAVTNCPRRSPGSIPVQIAQTPQQSLVGLLLTATSLIQVTDLARFVAQPLLRNSERGPPTPL